MCVLKSILMKRTLVKELNNKHFLTAVMRDETYGKKKFSLISASFTVF